MIDTPNLKSIDINDISKLTQQDMLGALNPDSIAPAVTSEAPREPQSDFFAMPLGRRTVEIRKWKVKDRLTLKKSFNANDAELQVEKTLKILVWNCINGKIALNKDELEYVFAQIRRHSIGDAVEFQYTCQNPDCNKLATQKMYISQIWRPQFQELRNFGDFEFQEIQNIDYYNKKMQEYNYSSMIDLALHIKTYKGQPMSDTEYLKIFENLNTDEMDSILDTWEAMVFHLDRYNSMICPHCQTENGFDFDEIPNLIPPVWFRR